EPEYARSLVHLRPKDAHKVVAGRTLIVAGSRRYRGAATLAVLGALRGGAGLVTLASTADVCGSVIGHVPEAILMPTESECRTVDAELARQILASQDQFDSAVFGPGLDDSAEVAAFFAELLPAWKVRSVYDASALKHF